MYTVMNLPTKIKAALTSRLKIMSKLDIAERRLPQDGRIKLKLGKKRDIDFRVSVLPTLFGEKTVLRILDKANLQVDLTKLGFEQGALDDFMEALNKPFGMILVTGPTGSGKTTTLYSALNYLNKPDTNIMTAEDPVEFNFMGINQCHVREDIGLTFASALRSFLRQDPDIIMVGEIRDFETAEIGVKAALTGHLVLSTLHTNDAPGTVSRLLNMGIEPFLVSSAVVLIMAQRLARRICQQCKDVEKVPVSALLQGKRLPGMQ
jgi:type IV pilus assembly protein PilB